jgi:Zn-dependent protease with chaperone function
MMIAQAPALPELTKIEPVPLSFTYRATLGVVTCAMVLLPLIYLALIGLVSWAVAWYAMNGWPLFSGMSSNPKFRIVLFVAPLIVGVTVVIFLIKPLFSRPEKQENVFPLDPADEAALFEFVRRTALAVGAPAPREIRLDNNVNASASYRRGLLSLFSDDFVLTLGAPLVAGLTLEQLAGVLAHEFGHFGQRAGMRLSYVIRSVNHWFARVVYERDRFDAYLDQAEQRSEISQIHFTASIASFCVRMSRGILKKLMDLGNMISSSLLRQMEYDADCYAVRLVGRNVHTSILRDLFLLSRVYQITLSTVPSRRRHGTLTDSLATLMQANRRRLAGRLDEAYREHLARGRTHLFDTHPTDSERIAKGLSGPVEGVFASDLPASVLFRDFVGLERARSRSLFESFLGPLPSEAFVPVEQAQAELEEGSGVRPYSYRSASIGSRAAARVAG